MGRACLEGRGLRGLSRVSQKCVSQEGFSSRVSQTPEAPWGSPGLNSRISATLSSCLLLPLTLDPRGFLLSLGDYGAFLVWFSTC